MGRGSAGGWRLCLNGIWKLFECWGLFQSLRCRIESCGLSSAAVWPEPQRLSHRANSGGQQPRQSINQALRAKAAAFPAPSIFLPRFLASPNFFEAFFPVAINAAWFSRRNTTRRLSFVASSGLKRHSGTQASSRKLPRTDREPRGGPHSLRNSEAAQTFETDQRRHPEKTAIGSVPLLPGLGG